MVWAYSSIPSSFCRLFVLIEVTLCIRLIKVACTIYSCDNGCFHCAPAPNKKRLLNFLSQQRCSIKKGVLKNFAKFTGKHLRSLRHLRVPTEWDFWLHEIMIMNPQALFQIIICFKSRIRGQRVLHISWCMFFWKTWEKSRQRTLFHVFF